MSTVSRFSVSLAIALGLLAVAGLPVWAGVTSPLSDSELDQIYGGKPDDEKSTVADGIVTSANIMTQTITGAAQQGTSALIGPINAVNSQVNAQVNVIANLGGTVGRATQTNGVGSAR